MNILVELGQLGEVAKYLLEYQRIQNLTPLKKTGGAKTHTLTTAQIPSHRHNIQFPLIGTGGGLNSIYGMIFNAAANGGSYTSYGPQTSGETRIGIYDTGGGQAHNNLQPYITCYMWKRTA